MPFGSYKCLLKQILENSSSSVPTDPETDTVVDSLSSSEIEKVSSSSESEKLSSSEKSKEKSSSSETPASSSSSEEIESSSSNEDPESSSAEALPRKIANIEVRSFHYIYMLIWILFACFLPIMKTMI